MRLLGPVLGRLQAELLQPLIDRSFALLLRAGLLPEPPEELQGQNIDIEYVSPLAKAQKLTDLQAMLRGFEILLQVSEVAPVTDYLDGDKMVQYLVETAGLPARIIRGANEVAQVRKEQAEQAQVQQQMQQEMMAAEAGGNIAPLVNAVGAAQQ
tara:strand:- start:628 stop:1089 length:462 start_codon:yes stop_codon:yes gene_type:complete